MVHSSYLKGEEPRQLLEKRKREEGRLPPGQSASLKWPVLHVGADPVFDAATWHFKTGGLVEAPLTLNWTQMTALPRVEIVTDFHCVTRWSTFDNRWEGVPIREVLSLALGATWLPHAGRPVSRRAFPSGIHLNVLLSCGHRTPPCSAGKLEGEPRDEMGGQYAPLAFTEQGVAMLSSVLRVVPIRMDVPIR